MFEPEALKALGAFPIVQAAVAILVLLAGIYLMRRGEKDKKNLVEPVPQWLMMGPAHDAIGAIHDIAEQGRGTNHILDRAEKALADIAKEQRTQTQLLEQIANENMINPRRLRE